MKRLTATGMLVIVALLVPSCGRPATSGGIHRHNKHGYTVAVPAGWTAREEDDGSLRIEAPGPKDANDQAPTVYIMVVDRPEGWSWLNDVEDMPNQLDDYKFLGKGTHEQAGVSYSWVMFACNQSSARHKNFNCTIPVGNKIITLACFADENRFGELEDAFKKCVFSIDPGVLGRE